MQVEHLRIAEPDRDPDNGVENRLQIAAGARDDPQHLRRRRLLLQRLVALAAKCRAAGRCTAARGARGLRGRRRAPLLRIGLRRPVFIARPGPDARR